MNPNSHISRLIYRSLIGLSTPDEAAELEAWLSESESNRTFYSELTSPESLAAEMAARNAIDSSRPAADMARRLAAGRRKRIMGIALRSAAVVAVLLGAAWCWYAIRPAGTPAGQLTSEVRKTLSIDDLTAGTTRATITDSSGHTVFLTDEESGQEASNHLIRNTPEVYAGSEARELCLDVPRGGEFKITLEDSTEVWLNAQSTLCFPETFSASERRVKVSGEAYFKVHKETDRPFYVESDSQMIRVYGTTFNVRAYSDETAIYTTLETGSISLTRADNNAGEVFLSCGHQAVLARGDDNVKLSVVDPTVVTSWRHGRFVFEDQPLERIMRDMSRWYDFEYEFEDPSLAQQIFMGSTERYSDFRTAIQVLENCGGIRFSITPDDKVLISKIKK